MSAKDRKFLSGSASAAAAAMAHANARSQDIPSAAHITRSPTVLLAATPVLGRSSHKAAGGVGPVFIISTIITQVVWVADQAAVAVEMAGPAFMASLEGEAQRARRPIVKELADTALAVSSGPKPMTVVITTKISTILRSCAQLPYTGGVLIQQPLSPRFHMPWGRVAMRREAACIGAVEVVEVLLSIIRESTERMEIVARTTEVEDTEGEGEDQM